MTDDKDFKRLIRERQAKTGESYTSARRQLRGGDRLEQIRDELAAGVGRYWSDFRPSLRGLTDDEYRWQPTAGCPTIHRQDDGTYRADHQFPIQGAASIAQRLCWIAQLIAIAANQHFGDRSITRAEVANVPGTARGGVDFLETAMHAWLDGLANCPPAFLLEHSENRSPGAIDGQFPFVSVVEFHFEQLVRCGSQVSMLRELYVAAHPEVVPTS